jgi:pseudaminic acid biosynthesis-associated methylase
MVGKTDEAGRLEALWQGNFGDEYTLRNTETADERLPFWRDVLTGIEVERVLEIGCNLGSNLKTLSTLLTPRNVYGIDVNESALAKVRASMPAVNPIWSKARELPFRDRYFDLTFTTGVLIHQPPDTLPDVMSEIVRCSRRYVLAGEYFAEQMTEVPYRGNQGALFKADYGGLYLQRFPELKLVRKGFLPLDGVWDDVTWWLLERR